MKKFFFLFLVLCLSCGTVTMAIPRKIVVSQDGTGDFKTVQDAVNAVRDLAEERVFIYIHAGIYREKLVIPSWKTNISLIGDSKENTVITNADYSGKPLPGTALKMNTFTSYTVLVAGNDITAENLTIENTAGRVGQAVALHVEGDRCIFRNCRLSGNQDTLYAGKEGSRQLYQNCYIEGTTDFIFGQATAVFEDCIIKSLANSFITAAATSLRQAYGFVLLHCDLIAAPGVDKVYLGRPWRPHAKTVLIGCRMGVHVVHEGWDAWKGDQMFPDKENTAYYAEYGSTGSGASPGERVAWSKQLKPAEAKLYTIPRLLAGADHWVP